LIQKRVASSELLNAINRESAAHTATESMSSYAIGRTPGLSSLMKNSLNVCMHKESLDKFNQAVDPREQKTCRKRYVGEQNALTL
jgi:hypothetical protein